MSKEAEQPTVEIFALDDCKERPIALSYDPDRTSTERFRMVVLNQITRIDPKTIYCNIGGVYDEVSSFEFASYRDGSEEEIKRYVEELVSVLKGPYTSEVILSDPPSKW